MQRLAACFYMILANCAENYLCVEDGNLNIAILCFFALMNLLDEMKKI